MSLDMMLDRSFLYGAIVIVLVIVILWIYVYDRVTPPPQKLKRA